MSWRAPVSFMPIFLYPSGYAHVLCVWTILVWFGFRASAAVCGLPVLTLDHPS